jgi:hypothetical protein
MNIGQPSPVNSISTQAASAATKIPQQQAATPQRSVNFTFTVVIAVTGVPQTVPGLRIPSGSSVQVRPGNGTASANAHGVFVGNHREAVIGNGGMPLAPTDAAQPFPVDSLAQVWVNGTAGDGIVVMVTSATTS